MRLSRRRLLGLLAGVPPFVAAFGAGLSGGIGASGCGASDACVDPEALSTGQASLRASVRYAARSPVGDEQACVACRFFRSRPEDANGCGDCEILQGPVNPRGRCDSWSARA